VSEKGLRDRVKAEVWRSSEAVVQLVHTVPPPVVLTNRFYNQEDGSF
jgi:hypothetical protein